MARQIKISPLLDKVLNQLSAVTNTDNQPDNKESQKEKA